MCVCLSGYGLDKEKKPGNECIHPSRVKQKSKIDADTHKSKHACLHSDGQVHKHAQRRPCETGKILDGWSGTAQKMQRVV